jgi:hypothetical protein
MWGNIYTSAMAVWGVFNDWRLARKRAIKSIVATGDRFYALCADGSVWFISPSSPSWTQLSKIPHK